MNNIPRGVWLDDLTRQEAASRLGGNAVVVVPVASGRDLPTHLPLKSPAVIVRALAQLLVERLPLVVTPVLEAEGRMLDARLERLRRLGATRLAVLDLRLWGTVPSEASGDVLMLRVCDRVGADEFGTSCMLALDPRSVRMAMLRASSRAHAFAGERGMTAEIDAAVDTLVAQWPDLS